MAGTWRDPCTGTKCGRCDCPRCHSNILPPEERGSKKPNRRVGSRVPLEKGYRVVLTGADPDLSLPTFSTPDAAIASAKEKAKRFKSFFTVIRHGVKWLLVQPDGSMGEVK